ncbi:MAG: cell division protein SepF [Lachnospiraceae bacterium]|nr:cell division protein SepF [Lachnospiraceae bacterium]
MAGLGKLMNFLKLTDEDDVFEDDYYSDDYAYDQKEMEREEKRLLKEQKREERRAAAAFRDKPEKEGTYFEEEPAPTPVPKRANNYRSVSGSKVVQMPATSGDMEVCIVKPSNIDEAQQVCTLLMEAHPVVVNLEGIDVMEAQRIMDFVAGCIYAVSGNMCQVSRYIFIFSPKDIDISGDYLKSLENEEIYNIASFSKEF